MPVPVPVPVLWLYGADAVGKSTVAWEVYEQLTGRGVPAAYVDIDYLGFCQPLIGDTPNRLVELNLASMWPNCATAGARCLIAAGVMVTREDRRSYEAAVPGGVLTLCRLRATPPTCGSGSCAAAGGRARAPTARCPG